MQSAGGQVIASRSSPRSSYVGYDLYSPWDVLQVGYFLSYAMWNYLTTPFLLTYPGVQTRVSCTTRSSPSTRAASTPAPCGRRRAL